MFSWQHIISPSLYLGLAFVCVDHDPGVYLTTRFYLRKYSRGLFSFYSDFRGVPSISVSVTGCCLIQVSVWPPKLILIPEPYESDRKSFSFDSCFISSFIRVRGLAENELWGDTVHQQPVIFSLCRNLSWLTMKHWSHWQSTSSSDRLQSFNCSDNCLTDH